MTQSSSSRCCGQTLTRLFSSNLNPTHNARGAFPNVTGILGMNRTLTHILTLFCVSLAMAVAGDVTSDNEVLLRATSAFSIMPASSFMSSPRLHIPTGWRCRRLVDGNTANRIGQGPEGDAFDSTIRGLHEAEKLESVPMLNFAAQIDLDLVDLLERYFEHRK